MGLVAYLPDKRAPFASTPYYVSFYLARKRGGPESRWEDHEGFSLMLKRDQARYFSGLLRHSHWGLIVLAGVFGGAANLNPSSVSGATLSTLAEWTRQFSWWASPLCVALALILGLLRSWVGPPDVWEAVHEGLEAVREATFDDWLDEPEHFHRVTLFKFYRFRPSFRYWPWTRRLVAVERSGRHTRKAITSFRAPDTPDDTNGVAGEAWARHDPYSVSDLPDVSDEPDVMAVRKYADQSSVSRPWIRENQPQTRSLFGMRVEVGGERWGVIVLDSTEPDEIQGEQPFRLVARSLAPLLKGV